MDFAGYIARRYLRSRRHSRFLSRGSVTAIVGITLGVAVLNITLAIMNGFHAEMRRTFVENMPMISVITGQAEGFTDLGAVMDTIAANDQVTGVAPFIRQEAILTAARSFGPPRPKGVIIWGVEPDLVDTVQPLGKYIRPEAAVLANLQGGDTPRVILGSELANTLYTTIGDTVILTAPNGELDLDRIEAESRRFVVTGFFETGMYEFDSRFVYVGIGAAREFLGYPPQGASMIGVKVADYLAAGEVAESLQESLGRDYNATDWMTLNRNLFHWIKLEKRMMVALLGMIILIAGFNIIGILTMMVGERRREIGILLAMGAPRRQVMGIFVINGVQLGGAGVLLGTVLGLVGIAYFKYIGFNLPGDVYLVKTVPVLPQVTDFLVTGGITFAISLLAALWPSWEASNLKPMDIIRYT